MIFVKQPFMPLPPNPRVMEAIRSLPEGSCRTILDIGCGEGQDLRQAARLLGATGLGIDKNPQSIEQATSYAAAENLPLVFEQRDAGRIKDIGTRFDLVIIDRLLQDMGRERWDSLFRQAAASITKWGGIHIVNAYVTEQPVRKPDRNMRYGELEKLYKELGFKVLSVREDAECVRRHGGNPRVDSLATIVAMKTSRV